MKVEIETELIKIAAELVHGIAHEPELSETTPRYRVVKEIDVANERSRVLGLRVKSVFDKLRTSN